MLTESLKTSQDSEYIHIPCGSDSSAPFCSWESIYECIKNNGLLSQSNLEKKLNKSEETLKKEENNDKEFLNKKQSIGESYHIQTFDEMFND